MMFASMSPAGPPPSQAPAAHADERALLARLRAGDRAAFAALVGRHGGALLRFAQSFVRDRPLAEEVVQDAWVAALEHLDGFEGRSSLRTWLFQIVANRARTRLQREGRSVPFSALEPAGEEQALDPGRFAADGHWLEPPAGWSVQDPERLAQDAQTRAAIERAIAELPPAQRAVITLRDLEELEAEEICNLLGVTLSNQRVLLHRARTKVRAALEKVLGGARR